MEQHKFRALHIIIVIFRVLAVLALIGAVAMAVLTFVGSSAIGTLTVNGQAVGGSKIVLALGILIVGLIWSLLWFGAAELISLFIHIERNTHAGAEYARQTALMTREVAKRLGGGTGPLHPPSAPTGR